jgi:hypothetical protein
MKLPGQMNTMEELNRPSCLSAPDDTGSYPLQEWCHLNLKRVRDFACIHETKEKTKHPITGIKFS